MSDFDRAARNSRGVARTFIRCRGCRGFGRLLDAAARLWRLCADCKGSGRS